MFSSVPHLTSYTPSIPAVPEDPNPRIARLCVWTSCCTELSAPIKNAWASFDMASALQLESSLAQDRHRLSFDRLDGKRVAKASGRACKWCRNQHELLSRVLRGRGVTNKLVFFHELDVRSVGHDTVQCEQHPGREVACTLKITQGA
jgi:hypothetical protein